MDEISLPQLEFPCIYPVKVIGLNTEDFLDFVQEILSHHVPGLTREAYTTHLSSGGKYMSVSVTITAESRTQVDALYQELGQHKRVRVAL